MCVLTSGRVITIAIPVELKAVFLARYSLDVDSDGVCCMSLTDTGLLLSSSFDHTLKAWKVSDKEDWKKVHN